MMTTVAEAIKIIEENTCDFGVEKVPFMESPGRILAEDIYADRDFPPYHRAAMDGIAISYRDWEAGTRTFEVVGEQFAGAPPQMISRKGTCIEIMTGATLPEGADVVVRYEDTILAKGHAEVHLGGLKPWANVHKRGTDCLAGERLIAEGKQVGPGDIGILASVGKTQVQVKSLPRVALISTGDELVAPHLLPLPHQVRKSNVYTLGALLAGERVAYESFHFQDEKEEIRMHLSRIIRDFDVVILSGGVSKGKRDFIPEVLQELGIRKLFHGVQQRPGKPLWFGAGGGATVFGFPGNPVSALVSYLAYFRHWLQLSLGQPIEEIQAVLTAEVHFTPRLTYFLPVELSYGQATLKATPLPGHGSGDLVNLSAVDSFMVLPAARDLFGAGEVYPVLSLRGPG